MKGRMILCLIPPSQHKIGQGLTPLQFIENMKIREMQLSRIPNTKELFRQVYERFQWENKESERFFTSEQKPIQPSTLPDSLYGLVPGCHMECSCPI